MASSNTTAPAGADGEKLPEPSMGPACLVICILTLAAAGAFCAFGSFFFFSDQSALAEKGITKQLIPWVEKSNLPPNEKRQILETLNDVVEKVRARDLEPRQLTRLKNALEDNAVLLWGTVQEVLAQADEAGLTEVEKEAAKRIEQRLLRATADRVLSRNDLEFALAECARGRTDGMGIEARRPLTAAQIKEFLKRSENLLTKNNVPDEPFEKSLSEVFEGMIKEALTLK